MESPGNFENLCEQHEAELAALRALVETTRTEIAVMQEIFKRFDKTLFGNGRPGLLESKADVVDVEEIKKEVKQHSKLIWVAIGATIAANFLFGSGVLSLKGLIGH